MPNPKRRHSKRRKNQSLAHYALTDPSISECPQCHQMKMPHQACPECGYYKGREVVDTSS